MKKPVSQFDMHNAPQITSMWLLRFGLLAATIFFATAGDNETAAYFGLGLFWTFLIG